MSSETENGQILQQCHHASYKAIILIIRGGGHDYKPEKDGVAMSEILQKLFKDAFQAIRKGGGNARILAKFAKTPR